ncbi:ATP-dependent helicase HrpB [Tumebacillus sp. BK434]|uniref:ATP-dependent helicase HrpB n=1 Tax=Tumebacillus sp. BK434 TaxID=2512169 RepID=UPI001048B647|nr:ATP-dependent helicase HrpB [Tumebacillus sp. BK434]TCP52153.1 ATP-dependent helicase HrpB [Tumebacillus sp. BK434]
MPVLPIDAVLPALTETLRTRENAVLVAAPGAGKTTRVPLALLDEPWLQGKKIIMLEPRRLAARAAAAYMARQLGEQTGETVGYRVRMDTKVGPKTRIEVITEGVLTRMLQSDPALEEAGIVIFDEFHERNLHGDLGLALCLQSQQLLREDLRVLVMSATLEAEPVAALLGGAPVLQSVGRAYPVETRFLERRAEGRIEPLVVRTIQTALAQEAGDLLVFLPGAGEIRRVESLLHEQGLRREAKIMPLHGTLAREAQDAAIAPSRPGERKIVLATSIAETSLTVEGVRVVIDSGLMRVPRFSPRTGMTRLETVTVSRASAEQRRGRAGRVAPGVCYRLWTEHEDKGLPARSTPEILEADLAPLALELAVWGVTDPAELAWMDAPPAPAFAQARELLAQLGALRDAGTLTEHGKRMAEFGLHPRLAHMVLRAVPLQLGGLACELAAVLNERDFLKERNADLRLRIEALQRGQADRRMTAEANQWKRALNLPAGEKGNLASCGLLLAFAYPDRIAQRRGNGRFLLRNGRGAALAEEQPLSFVPYLVAAELDDQGAESRIFLAAEVEEAELREHCQEQIVTEQLIEWDASAHRVRARKRERLGALLLKEAPLPNPDAERVLVALLSGIRQEGLDILPWTKAAKQFRERLSFLHRHDPSWPDVSRAGLIDTLTDWLAPHLYGLKNRDDLQRLQLISILETMLSWEQRRELDEQAPTHLTVPSGSRIPIDYSDPDAPVLAVRLQEMFGLQATPRIAGGRVPLTLHLLSPAHRPVQVTRDLASFWQNTYFEVKKDLKGRYPKHHWPDDAYSAVPTNRAKPRGS